MINRRFYSTGFDIASYVSRIQTIAQNQKTKSKAQEKPRHASGAQQKTVKNSPKQGKRPQNIQKINSAAKTGPAQNKPFKSGPPDGQKPGFLGGAAKAPAARGARTNQGKQGAARGKAPDALADATAETSFAFTAVPAAQGQPLAAGASSTTKFERPRAARGRAPHQKPKPKRFASKGRSARAAAKPGQTSSQRVIGGLPLIYPVNEGLEAIFNSATTGFIEPNPMTPRTIAENIVPGPTYNARVWSVINSSATQSQVNSRVNGEYFVLEEQPDDANTARSINSNHSLNGDQKQFLAKVAAGHVPPSQVKQVRF